MFNKKNRPVGNQDETEKNRKLTEAELQRKQAFEALADEMQQNGYRRTDLTISIVKANLFAIVLLIPVLIIGFGGFTVANRQIRHGFTPGTFPLLSLLLAILIVVHELIHGISWAAFTEHHFGDIEFGFMKQYLTPYCACKAPLSRGQYITGALMPLLILGIIPLIAGIAAGSLPFLLIGIVMTDAAAGDIMIGWNILRYESSAATVVYIDHPTQGGGVIFEKGE